MNNAAIPETAGNDIPSNRLPALEVLLSGGTQAEAGRASQVTDRTVRNWIAKSPFGVELREARIANREELLCLHLSLQRKAALCLVQVMQDPHASASARVAAAKTLLTLGAQAMAADLEADRSEPAVPAKPEKSGKSGNPEGWPQPTVPAVPAIPFVPAVPAVPFVPAVPAVPTVPLVPETPAEPEGRFARFLRTLAEQAEQRMPRPPRPAYYQAWRVPDCSDVYAARVHNLTEDPLWTENLFDKPNPRYRSPPG